MKFASLFPFVLAAAAYAGPAEAIVGPSRDGDAYADRIVMVLSRHGGREGVCTGVAIAPRVVLTAAHCLAGANEVLVATRIHGKTEPAAVSAVMRHPGYDPDASRLRRVSIDVGLVEMAEPLPQGFAISALAEATPPVGQPLTVVGFGLRHEGGAPSDGHARAADLVVSEPVSKVVIWARDPARSGLGACQGDSGGRFFRRNSRSSGSSPGRTAKRATAAGSSPRDRWWRRSRVGSIRSGRSGGSRGMADHRHCERSEAISGRRAQPFPARPQLYVRRLLRFARNDGCN